MTFHCLESRGESCTILPWEYLEREDRRAVIRDLSGFGCRIYAYDAYENEEVKKYAQYADLDTIYKECDLLTLHMPLEAENAHLLDAAAFAKIRNHLVPH